MENPLEDREEKENLAKKTARREEEVEAEAAVEVAIDVIVQDMYDAVGLDEVTKKACSLNQARTAEMKQRMEGVAEAEVEVDEEDPEAVESEVDTVVDSAVVEVSVVAVELSAEGVAVFAAEDEAAKVPSGAPKAEKVAPNFQHHQKYYLDEDRDHASSCLLHRKLINVFKILCVKYFFQDNFKASPPLYFLKSK